MLDRHPQESEARSWFYVGTWTLCLFATVPMARAIQAYVRDQWGRDAFLYGVILVVAAVSLIAALKLKTGKRAASAGNYLWLFVSSAALIAYTVHLRDNPEEALHFLQYGLLALLVYRALTHRISDPGIYVVAALLTASVGIVDEALQWLTPDRVWALADIGLNGVAAILVLLGLARGLSPGIISGQPDRASGLLLCRAALLFVVLLGSSLLNTPQRISWYVDKLPALRFILANSSVMAEYGYRYTDPEAGVFRSRLAPEHLRQTDRLRAPAAAASLDRLPALSDYTAFLRIYTPFTDPFLHEARVHLNSRDYYLQSAADYADQDKEEFQRRMTIAYHENRIMEKYFTETLMQSGFRLPQHTVAYMKKNALHDSPHESAVSESLLTIVNEQQVFWITLLLGLSLFITERWLTARNRP